LKAVAGIENEEITLRELIWAVEAVRREAWQHTSFVVANVINTQSKRKITPAQINPFSKSEKVTELTPNEGWAMLKAAFRRS
jgi:hypothetical protein